MDVKTRKAYAGTQLYICYKWDKKFGSEPLQAFFGGTLSGIVIMVESVDSENCYIK
jgi:hypothetical protein